MTPRLAVAAAIAALFAAPVLAASPAHDDTTYPGPAAMWAGTTASSTEVAVEGGDVTYPGPHAAILKGAPPRVPVAGSLARLDDTTYPVADPAAPRARAAARDDRLACGCTRR